MFDVYCFYLKQLCFWRIWAFFSPKSFKCFGGRVLVSCISTWSTNTYIVFLFVSSSLEHICFRSCAKQVRSQKPFSSTPLRLTDQYFNLWSAIFGLVGRDWDIISYIFKPQAQHCHIAVITIFAYHLDIQMPYSVVKNCSRLWTDIPSQIMRWSVEITDLHLLNHFWSLISVFSFHRCLV